MRRRQVKSGRETGKASSLDRHVIDGLRRHQFRTLTADDMQAVDQVIRTRLHSDVVLIRQVAEYIISAGGKRLRPVLSELVIDRSGGEWDTRCAGEFSDTKGLLIITERPGNKGYHDLLLKQSRVESRVAEVAGECETVEESTRRVQFRIEYDEQRYLLPIEFSPV